MAWETPLSALLTKHGALVGAISVECAGPTNPVATGSAMTAAPRISGGRGVRAAQRLSAGDELLRVPSSCLLCGAEPEAVCVQLLHERARLDASPFFEYIRTLPVAYSTPLGWCEAQLQLLQCDRFIGRVKRERAELARRFARLEAQGALPRGSSLDDFTWAVGTVLSRSAFLPLEALPLEPTHDASASGGGGEDGGDCGGGGGRTAGDPPQNLERPTRVDHECANDSVDGEARLWRHGGLCLVPLGDMFNHSALSTARAVYDEASDCYVYIAGDDTKAGDEVFLNYGAHDDETLLLLYGFVPAENPLSRRVLGSSGAQALLLCDDDLRWLRRHALLSEWSVSANGPSFGLLAALRLLHASAAERERGAALSILEGERVSERCEVRALEHVIALIDVMAAEFGTTLDEDLRQRVDEQQVDGGCEGSTLRARPDCGNDDGGMTQTGCSATVSSAPAASRKRARTTCGPSGSADEMGLDLGITRAALPSYKQPRPRTLDRQPVLNEQPVVQSAASLAFAFRIAQKRTLRAARDAASQSLEHCKLKVRNAFE
uniref:SET domain-containing protein n=2 Tax=Calcidiscus leptoporus TaxID=127549 RepID=A0A7S0P1K3_9EUKA|mmetsp:Transcript_49352/g.114064  ORF Transcript_49352/g.114064 Transcript_49352/m.114064 type:complete len:549 (+) Transcript_49352:137-1783(+)|eukprot:CAMPEP_0119364130 /NCGR_PEP_ID=MMETSP1334-20130426/11045_1 /TAXON_ID=127549 /ORGANISM="Calcidiscus leptoporus, Strain RCC1130" /LENGTH=548 /DNA_ID=CAMNT_0007379751 /DNA_START=54 /DNA_END=1700 /DNA_ORIENTATION=+